MSNTTPGEASFVIIWAHVGNGKVSFITWTFQHLQCARRNGAVLLFSGASVEKCATSRVRLRYWTPSLRVVGGCTSFVAMRKPFLQTSRVTAALQSASFDHGMCGKLAGPTFSSSRVVPSERVSSPSEQRSDVAAVQVPQPSDSLALA